MHNRKCFWLISVFGLILFSPLSAAQEKVGALGYLQPRQGIVRLINPDSFPPAVKVKVNDRVKKGQVLAIFVNEATAKLQLSLFESEQKQQQKIQQITQQQLQNAIALAQLELDRVKQDLQSYKALDNALLSQKELRLRQSRVKQAQLQLQKARLDLQLQQQKYQLQQQQAKLRHKQLQQQYQQTLLTAPLDASVLSVSPQAGKGQTLIVLADMEHIQVKAEVFEGDLPKIKTGSNALLKNKVFRQPLKAKVSRISHQVNASSKTGMVWLDLQQAKPANRYLGMEVRVEFLLD